MKKYNVEDNPFDYLYFDPTYNCNMNCNICFNKNNITNNKNYFMDKEYFEEFCKRLPKNKKLFINIAGGEPTLHPQLHDFINTINKYKHTVNILTNGLNFSKDDFIEKIKTWTIPKEENTNPFYMGGEYPFCVSFDISGGTTQNKYYKAINNQNCLEDKMNGIKNVIKIGVRSIALTAIIIRGLNESVIPEIINLAKQHREIIAINFRNLSPIGCKEPFNKKKPYSVLELKDLVEQYIPNIDNCKTPIGWTPPPGKECYGCCYRFITDYMRVSFIDFASEDSSRCWKRGYISNENYTVSQVFKRIQEEGHIE